MPEEASPAATGAIEELGWWLNLLAEADRLARHLPPSMAARIDANGGPHELMQLTVLWAAVSAETRHRMQVGLEHAVMALRLVDEINPQHVVAPLRLVEPAVL